MPVDQGLSFSHLAIPLLGLSIPIVAIVAHYLARAHADRQRHETLREFARAGQPVPPELLIEPGGRQAGRDALAGRPGSRVLVPAVVNLGLGIGIAALFAVMSPASWLWAIGLVPLALGLALLLLWLATRKPPSAP